MYKGKKIGIVVPAYNEEFLISKTMNGMPEYADAIYVTDDCSTDKTADIVLNCAQKDNRIRLIQHSKNQGVGGAIVSGFKGALHDEMDIVIIMAGDNQMDAKYLPDLIQPLLDNTASFTKGNRLKIGYWKGMSFFRLFGNLLLTLITKIVTGYWNIADPQNGYVALTTDCLRKIDLESLYKGYAFENDLMLKTNILNIPMKNVNIPAFYGEEKSKIKYGNFIYRTSTFLFKGFFWRIWEKYFKTFRLVGLLIPLGLLSIIAGVIVGIVLSFKVFWPIIVTGGFLLLLAFLIDGISSFFFKL